MPDKVPGLNDQILKLVGITERTHEATKFIKEDVKEIRADVRKTSEAMIVVSGKVGTLETEVSTLKKKNGMCKSTPRWVQRIKDNYLYALMLAVGAAVVQIITTMMGGG